MFDNKTTKMNENNNLLNIKERRLFQRCPVSYTSYIFEDDSFLCAKVVNISEEGLCMNIPERHRIGDEINLKVKCLICDGKNDPEDMYIYLKGKCIWTYRNGKHYYTAGLKIVNISREDLHKLKNLIQILYLMPFNETNVMA